MTEVKTEVVCNLCGEKWDAPSNPGTCPECENLSFGISREIKIEEVKNGDD